MSDLCAFCKRPIFIAYDGEWDLVTVEYGETKFCDKRNMEKPHLSEVEAEQRSFAATVL